MGAVLARPENWGAIREARGCLRAVRRRWAQLIRRINEVDPLICPRCGATMRIIAFITEPTVIKKILRHLTATGVDTRSPPQGGTAAA